MTSEVTAGLTYSSTSVVCPLRDVILFTAALAASMMTDFEYEELCKDVILSRYDDGRGFRGNV